MTDREKLWYLINGLLDGSYMFKTFCSEFTRIYNLETDYDSLSADEDHEFNTLCEMAERCSEDEEELKIPNMFYRKEEVINQARGIVAKLRK